MFVFDKTKRKECNCTGYVITVNCSGICRLEFIENKDHTEEF